MKIEEYKDLANRTLAKLGSERYDTAHMVLGIVSEIWEMANAKIENDRANLVEEFGDINWFVAGLCKIHDFSFEDIYNDAGSDTPSEITFGTIGRIADMAKGLLAYNRSIDSTQLRQELISLMGFLKKVASEEKIDYVLSLEKNIEKLRVRFPKRFSEEQANDRDTGKERKVLES